MAYVDVQDRVTAAMRELAQLADDLEDIRPKLSTDQKLEITRRLVKISETLSP